MQIHIYSFSARKKLSKWNCAEMEVNIKIDTSKLNSDNLKQKGVFNAYVQNCYLG